MKKAFHQAPSWLISLDHLKLGRLDKIWEWSLFSIPSRRTHDRFEGLSLFRPHLHATSAGQEGGTPWCMYAAEWPASPESEFPLSDGGDCLGFCPDPQFGRSCLILLRERNLAFNMLRLPISFHLNFELNHQVTPSFHQPLFSMFTFQSGWLSRKFTYIYMLKVEGNWNARASLQHRSGAEARFSGTPRPFYPVFHTREIAPITGPTGYKELSNYTTYDITTWQDRSRIRRRG